MIEITRKYARRYVRAKRGEKTLMLNEFCALTGLSRSRARHRLAEHGKRGNNVAKIDFRKQRRRKYSFDAVKVLQQVWNLSGRINAKYLAISMELWLDSLQAHQELVLGQGRYSLEVRAELLAMSGATIGRYLRPQIQASTLKGKSATKAGSLLRNSIKIRRASDEIETIPGFFEGDTVAHCGPSLKGEFVRTLTLTDFATGWLYLEAIRNNAHKWILQALNHGIDRIPFPVTGLDFDNGSEFINHEVIAWAGGLDIFFTRARPYKSNDQAQVESKNGHFVRANAFYYRYDTVRELELLNQMWPKVCDLANFFTPTKKPVGWGKNHLGRRKRIYDTPATPFARLKLSGVLSQAEIDVLEHRMAGVNPAELTRGINRIGHLLMQLAADKTDRMRAKLYKPVPSLASSVSTG